MHRKWNISVRVSRKKMNKSLVIDSGRFSRHQFVNLVNSKGENIYLSLSLSLCMVRTMRCGKLKGGGEGMMRRQRPGQVGRGHGLEAWGEDGARGETAGRVKGG